MTVQSLRDLGTDETGATAIEYGLLAGLISLAILSAITTAGEALVAMFEYIANGVSGVAAG